MYDQKLSSNEHFSTPEKSESCFAQPKPCMLGRESTLYDNGQRESLPPLEKLKVSAVSTANGVKSICEQPLAEDVAPGKDAAKHSECTEKTQPIEGPGGKDDTTPGAEEEKKDVKAVTEAQPLKENAEAEPLGTQAEGQPLRTGGERDSPGVVEGAENPPTAREMMLLGTAENILPLETATELRPQEAMEKDEQVQLLETIPRENESPEILEGSQPVEIAEEQQLQGTLGTQEQSQLLETIPKDHVTPEVLDRSQLVATPVMNDPLRKTPEGPGNLEQIRLEGIVGSLEHPAEAAETGAGVEIPVRKIHTNEEDQHIEGETGEKMETEMENEKVSEGAETKEEETGEAVDLSAAT
ncbi:PREDICTED: glutamate-rich protein 5 [Propithecus coquereli]|uniref:glutamate-rich protein 5 n=1 Tax=Propithecus coquereli TaxID=379532 RepID=UPI00063F2F23|nr:PREDICTED: glutamate-rich protein 5 [Propithecus coquereli]